MKKIIIIALIALFASCTQQNQTNNNSTMGTISFKIDGVPYSFTGNLGNGNVGSGCESHLNPLDSTQRYINGQSTATSFIHILLQSGEPDVLPPSVTYKPKSRFQILLGQSMYTVLYDTDSIHLSLTVSSGVVNGTFEGTVTKGFPDLDSNNNIIGRDTAVITDGIITDVISFVNTPITGGGGGIIVSTDEVIGEYHTGLTTPNITTGDNYITDTVRVFRNGARLKTTDFTEVSSNEITLGFTPNVDDEFSLDYDIVAAPEKIYGTYFTGLTSPVITLPFNYLPSSISGFKQGVRLNTTDFTETAADEITLVRMPSVDDEFVFDFVKI